MNDKYLKKENYITRYPEPYIWQEYHSNYQIMQASKQYINGVCGDLGCNHGALSLLLLNFDVKSITGFDINYKALEVAYNTALKINTNILIKFNCVNLCKMTIVSDNHFDFLMSFHTLEHIYPEDIDDFVSETFRILKPECHFLISIPYDHEYPDDTHVSFYVEKTLQELFEKHGFITIECFKDNRFDQKNLLSAIFKKPF